jgi:riboflavin kinase/FMN adenylyltransferase
VSRRRPILVRGTVCRGAARGKGLGFPTANIQLSQGALPAPGVYAARVELDGASYPAAATVGRSPTFEDTEAEFEVHLLDFDGDLYGRALAVTLLDRVRDQERFDSEDALRAQIARDLARIRALLDAPQGGG